MPPKKRKSPAVVPDTVPTRASKRVRIGETSNIDGDSRASAPSGRVKRSTSNDNPQYNFTRKGSDSLNIREAKVDVEVDVGPAKRARGHPPKDAAPELQTPVSTKRGILKNGKAKAATKPNSLAAEPVKPNTRAPRGGAANVTKKRLSSSAPSTAQASNNDTAVTGKKRGRPATKKKAGNVDTKTIVKLGAGVANGIDEPVDEDIQYWLMKAEPESRMEKGIDVKFSIDDLAGRAEPEGWDGVRNPAARNNMRAMRVGDLAFFYHSNCKIPGVAGVMRIVEEHSVDQSAFDPDHPYYDSKSNSENPKWELVKVEFVKKFNELVTLKDLRKFAQKDGALENMQMLKQGRLSVSAVRPAEWRFILELADEPPNLGHPEKKDGYDGETDGETEEQEAPAEDAANNSE